MNKLKFLIIFTLLFFNTAYASEPFITSNNILYGDSVYFKIPFEYEDVYAADISITYSDNLEFKYADFKTDGETAIYENGKNIHFGFLPNTIPNEITVCFKALHNGDAFIKINEITVISENLTEKSFTVESKTVFEIKSNAPSSGGGGGKGNSGSSGGGGGSAVSIPAAPIVIPEKITVQLPFSDIPMNHWAIDYITDLYEKEIISDDTLFRPDDFITRAEFVKLASLAFNISSLENQCSFSDVSEKDWFYPYVAAAENNGIVTGANSCFYPMQNITREDICVILYRIIKAAPTNEKCNFSDAESISDYAYDAVLKLSELSVITGNENREFNPKSYATRAETVKMISAVLKAVN